MIGLLLLLISGCQQAECAKGDYTSAECRVVAENEGARLLTSTGAEVRFQEPGAVDSSTWAPLGLAEEVEPGLVRLRPATLMDFAVSIDAGDAPSVSVVLDNVAPDTALFVGEEGQEVEVPAPDDGRLSRALEVPLGRETTWLRGRRPCPAAYRLVAAGDVQTNPNQFERVVEDLHRQADEADAAGEPLLGFLLLGDLAQDGEDAEFERIEEILAGSPVPISTVPGNHDVATNSAARYTRWFGPGNYAFDVCRTRVVLLDTGDGELAASVEARLPELLDPLGAEFLVGGTHYPAWADRTGAGFRDSMQAAYVLSEAARFGMDRLLAGHAHTWLDYPAVSTGQGDVHEIVTGTAGASQGAGVPHYGVTRLGFADEVTSCFDETPAPGRTDPGPDGPQPPDRCAAP
jgi:hypothetical protein